MNLKSLLHVALVWALAGSGGAGLRADSVERAELAALRAQVQQLEQQLQALSRQLELKEQAAAAASSEAPGRVTATDRAFGLASADARNSIRFRGLVQTDARLFFDDGGSAHDSLVLRRARLFAEGQFANKFGFHLVPEFGGSDVSLVDANVTIALSDWATARIGKFKVPVGHELLQSDSWTFFNERSLVTNLVPNRDIGVQLAGEIGARRLSYALGVFNGVADGASSTNRDFDDGKDVAGRVFVRPFRGAEKSRAAGLGLGLSGSFGRQETAAGRTSGYRTDGQQTFFAYRPGVLADGRTWRVFPHFDYRLGGFGAVGEYVLSVANLRADAASPAFEVRNRAWQLSAGYVLTGEASSSEGVTPRAVFDLAAGTWGAWEIVGRYAHLDVDDGVFPVLAAPASAASEANAYGLGLNWYLGKAAMVKFDYYRTRLGSAAGASAVPVTPALRQDEKALITRFQLSF